MTRERAKQREQELITRFKNKKKGFTVVVIKGNCAASEG